MLEQTAPPAGSETGPRRAARHGRLASVGLKRLVKWTFALASMGLLLWLVDWRSSLVLMTQLDPGLVAVVLVLNVLRIALSAWKWQLLLKALDIRIALPTALRIYWIGTFVSSFLPSTFGGDFVRTALSRRFGGIGPIAASVLMERLTGLGVLLLFVLAAILVRPGLVAHATLWFLLVLAIGGGLVALAAMVVTLLLRPRWIAAPAPAAGGSRWLQRLWTLAARLNDALAQYVRMPGVLLGACALSVVFYALIQLNQYYVIRAFGLEVALADVAAIAPIITLIAALPISVSGIGISEGAFVFFYMQVGLTPEQALAAALLRRLAMTLMTLCGGLVWLASPAEDRPAGKRPNGAAPAAPRR